MPLYDFRCKKCSKSFEELCGVNAKIKCIHCGSKKVEKLLGAPAVTFSNPKESSKWDSFSYRAGANMEKAKAERRFAEANDHMGVNPYGDKDPS